MKGKGLHMITWILLVVGGLNWLLTAFNWNLVAKILGADSTLTKVVYILVGLSALYELVSHKGRCKMCGTQSMGQTM